MRKTLLSALFLLLCAGWMLAQQTSGSKSTSSNESTIQGCLSSSAGSYIVTDKSGKTYQLEGDTSKLSAHVGHEVRVTGTESTAAPSGSQGGATTTTTEAKTKFNMTKVEHVSSSCSTAQK